jgi:hypothetical protein
MQKKSIFNSEDIVPAGKVSYKKMSRITNAARYTSYCNTVYVYLTPAGSVAALTRVGNGGIALQNIFIIY